MASCVAKVTSISGWACFALLADYRYHLCREHERVSPLVYPARHSWVQQLFRFVMRFGILIFLLALFGVIFGAEAKGEMREKTVMGWLESVFLKPWSIRVTAKLDTGAKTSSLHAEDIEHFTKDGQEWVRFTLIGAGDDDKTVVVERPRVRTVYIKERRARATRRDVVTMVLCKNGRDYETEFTLIDRSNFNYPVLLGRSFLKDVALVDSGDTFLYKADSDPCRSKKSVQ
ncbi:uncharacterized protein sS8_3289 [Methylocaldum marinum]|uniref:Retropepsin-like aspartic endopeptidase domain-containing protein n=2 Tax=Methylocaldum marinum TaxID=1432792 RepID=A0A250KUH0_9GAMM|nr:uncharacterized protein sS8_3289 [Methylocaldum marinum]